MTVTPGDLTATTSLEHLRIDGAIFLRAEYSEPWAFEAFDGPTTAAVLSPGSSRVTLFHVIAHGRCWVETPDGDRYWANEGDIIVLPYGDLHRMGGSEPAELVSLETFLIPPPWEEFPVLRHGAGGELTHVVCGYLMCDHPLFDPSMRALPPLFVVRPDDAASRWVQASIDYALEASATTMRIPELLLAEVLRLHLATAPIVDQGWLAALGDPVLAPALALLHGQPHRKWTVADLATAANVSKSLLDARFRQVLGESPIRYLTGWRMHVAADLLATTDASIFDIARRVGYDAEEAFSRAFKRERGEAPSLWRLKRFG